MLSERRRIHVIGGGPVGLMLTALLQTTGGFSVRLYEKRKEYTRTRMVKLDPYLVADSVESYCIDHIDEENIGALFDQTELEESVAFRRSISSDLMTLLRNWTVGFCPLNDIERALSDLINRRDSHSVERLAAAVTLPEIMAMLAPGDVVIDCTGSHSLLRDHLAPTQAAVKDANIFKIRLEYALIVTFLYSQKYVCDEYCKYYKNAENDRYKFIPAVHRTFNDQGVTHITGIINITPAEYEAMPSRFDGQWLRSNFPGVAQSMDRFIDRVKHETGGEILGELEIIRIPLDLYRARGVTSRKWHGVGKNDQHPFALTPVFLAGDSAIGSPYFQSISLGFECAMFLAGLLSQPDQPVEETFSRYETFMYKQWLRVYMRSKLIKHNKDLFETLDDTFALLEKLHIY